MLTSKECLTHYGDPKEGNNRMTWILPEVLHRGKIPSKIYLNRDLRPLLEEAFTNLISRGLLDELKSFDGCFCIRQMRGSKSMSLHSWGVAVDVNAATNQMGKTPTLSKEFVACFTDAGLEWGGNWKTPDGMHFQLKEV